MAGVVAPALFDRLSCRTTRLCFDVDGTFPNQEANTVMEANRRTLELLYSNVRAGRTAHEVAVEVKKGVEGVDGMIFRSGHFGYSIGLGFPPTWTDGQEVSLSLSGPVTTQ